MTNHRKMPVATRILSGFLLWTAVRSAYALYLGQADSDYRLAAEAGFGPAIWVAEGLYAFLATGAVAAIWLRAALAVPLILASLAVSASVMVFQLQQTEANPGRAREAYAESRRARGFPVADERLDEMFSPSGRRVAWGIGAVFVLGPLGLLLLKRRDFEASVDR